MLYLLAKHTMKRLLMPPQEEGDGKIKGRGDERMSYSFAALTLLRFPLETVHGCPSLPVATISCGLSRSVMESSLQHYCAETPRIVFSTAVSLRFISLSSSSVSFSPLSPLHVSLRMYDVTSAHLTHHASCDTHQSPSLFSPKTPPRNARRWCRRDQARTSSPTCTPDSSSSNKQRGVSGSMLRVAHRRR